MAQQKLKVLPGDGRKSPRGKSRILYKPPLPLPEAEREAWLRFAGWITDPVEADRVLLEMAAYQSAFIVRLRKDIREHGETYTTTTPQGSHMHRPRPQVKLLLLAEEQLLKVITLLGLIPRKRKPAPEPAEDPGSDRDAEFTDDD